MAEPIEVLLVAWTWVGPSNHVSGGGPDPPGEGEILEGNSWHTVKYREYPV